MTVSKRFTPLLITLLLIVLSHLFLGISAAPLWLRTFAALIITLMVPGYWLTRLILREPPRRLQSWLEMIALTVGSGYAIQVLGMTLLSYLPGGISPLHTLLTFHGCTLAMIVLGFILPTSAGEVKDDSPPFRYSTKQIVGMVVVIVGVAAFFRLTNLGYAEFQGDEARAVLRAAAILQGHPETLFLHRKGPTEIVITAIGYSLTGQLTESSARLPFALAGLMLPLVIFLLGWRLYSPIAGAVAGLLVALDGNFIGYGRIVQYHTVSHLMALLVLLLALRLLQNPRRPLLPSLLLAALFAGIGVLSHYENAQIAIPLLLLAWYLWRRGTPLRTLMGNTIVAGLVGIATVASFYVPFVLNPNFGNIADYLAENLVVGEGTFPYNHLAEIFTTATFYSTTYFMGLLLLLLTVAIAIRFQQRWGKGGILLAFVMMGGLVLSGIFPNSLTVGGTNLTILWALALLALLWLTPLTQGERLVWAWFGIQFIAVAFAVARPALHYIPMHLPWAIVAGIGAVELYRRLAFTFHRRAVAGGFALAGGIVAVVVGAFVYRNFVYNDSEYIRDWNWQPEYAWTLHNEQGNVSIFGFPHQSGWKAVGMLYAAGLLEGTYDTNTRDWIAEWYTRQALRCERTHTYYILESNELPWTLGPIREQLAQGFHPIGTVTVNGDPRLEIYQSGAATGDPLWQVEATDYTLSFDNSSTYVGLDLDTPVIDPNPEYDDFIQVDDHLWIEGYDLDRVEAAAGEMVRVSLYWRVRERMDEDLEIFTEVVADDGEIEGQIVREPGCYNRETSGWAKDRLVVDHYDIPIFDDAAEGMYMLVAGIYDESNGERWDFYNDAGDLLGDLLDLGDVRIEE